jgi:amidase
VAKDARLSRTQGLDAVLAQHKLDAIMTPAGTGANLASRAGYPIIAVPFGMVPNVPTPPLPAGFDARPAPYGVTFTGAQCSDPRLVGIAYAFEQASKKRVPPPDMP